MLKKLIIKFMTLFRKRTLRDKDGAVIVPTDENGKIFKDEVVLYNNATGTTGNVTLSESRDNFKFIDIVIHLANGTGSQKVVRVYKQETTDGFQNAFNLHDGNMNTYYRSYTVNGNTITVVQSYMWASTGYIGAYSGHYITKVVGYK